MEDLLLDFSLSLYSNSKFFIQINKKSSFTYPRDVVFFLVCFFLGFFCVCKMSFSQILVMLSIATSRAFPRSENKIEREFWMKLCVQTMQHLTEKGKGAETDLCRESKTKTPELWILLHLLFDFFFFWLENFLEICSMSITYLFWSVYH